MSFLQSPLRRNITYLLVTITFLSWWFPLTKDLWNNLDYWVFQTLNQSLTLHPSWAIFWAYMNANFMDRVMELLIFGIIFLGLRKLAKEKGRTYVAEFIAYYLLFTVISILFKRVLQSGLEIHRLSPTNIFQGTFRLKPVIPYALKDASRNSFPADHALFLLLMFQYAYRRLAKPYIIASFAVCILFCLPRLFSGGHWLTDVFFGGLMPSIIFAKWSLGENRILHQLKKAGLKTPV